MAFGALKGVCAGSVASIVNPFPTTVFQTGSGAVVVGDLVFCVVGQQTNLTATACADNLGNTYTATNAGTDAGTVSGRAFYSRVTVAGTITAVQATTTASTNDAVIIAAIFEGPFVPSPVDANIANATGDLTSPFTCPNTGVLAQASELVLCWGVSNGPDSWLATSPNLLAGEQIRSAVAAKIGYQVVSATTAIAPEFTSGVNPSVCLLGTTTFKAAKSLAADAGSYALTGTAATTKVGFKVAGAGGSYALSGTDATLTIASAAKILTADGGTYALSGTAASLEHGWVVGANAGSYALTGTAASTLHAWRVSAAGGSYALTGTDATMAIASDKLLAADGGSYSLTGTAASLLHTWEVAAEAGSYALTGTAATLTATSSEPEAPPEVGGGGISGGSFSRRQWEAIRKARKAQERAEEKAKELPTRTQRERVELAAEISAKAIELVQAAEEKTSLVKLTLALDAAASAQTARVRLAAASKAIAEAKALIARVAKEKADAEIARVAKEKADADEEEEAIALLLLLT
jgi:hypothetical protein